MPLPRRRRIRRRARWGHRGVPRRPELVAPSRVPRRRLGSDGGRAALLHAIAHIEFNAINLALDAAYRFRGMPVSYYSDWLRVAEDEARHFRMLGTRLAELGYAYGDFPAHNGLWEMAENGERRPRPHGPGARVLEARGLDVTPGMIRRLEQAGDDASVRVLRVILDEEVAHVAIGSRWFAWACARRGLQPARVFPSCCGVT
ncbi:MAG: ferritin-like domain-containing protein [Arhodomonas sp.]|nr:ferritin-like domain-containing protein [Arhodomonas sp.]